MMRHTLIILIALALVVIFTTVIYLVSPATWPVAKITGVDKYAFHQPFFANKTISQTFTVHSDTLASLNILIVDFKKQQPPSDITLSLAPTNSDQSLRTVTLAGSRVQDDYYLPFKFEPLKHTRNQTYTFTLSAPQTTSTAPFAIRLTEDKQSIAFSYDRSVTKFFIAQQWVNQHQHQLISVGLLVAIITALSFLLPWSAQKPQRWLVALLVILAFGTCLQLTLIPQLTGAVGGDAYYYLVAAKQITQGINPLADWSYRLPFYPLLLTPAVFTFIPDLLWGRLLGLAITISLGFGLIWLTKALRLRPVTAVIATALLYLNTDFVITALRPRPYTLFALELLIATATLFFIKNIKQAFLWGALLGLMGMTRQEAYLPTAILGLGFAIRLVAQKKSWLEITKYLAAATLPLILIISPYFYANYSDTGHPFTVTTYTSRDDLYFPTDFQAFWSGNLTRARDSLGAVWLPASEAGLRPHSGQQFLITLIITSGIYLFIKLLPAKNKNPAIFISYALATLALAFAIYRWQFHADNSWSQDINLILMSCLLIGLVEIIRITKWRGVLALAILGSQLLIATLFHPEPKHYQQTYPYLALAIAIILTPALTKKPLYAAPALLLIGFLGLANISHLENAIDAHNYPAAAYYVTTAAAEELEKYPPGNTAAEVDYTTGSGTYRLHSYQQRSLIRYSEDISPADQFSWLCQNKVTYILDHNELNTLTLHTQDPHAKYFSLLFEKTAAGRDDRKFKVSTYQFDLSSCHSNT